jgi:hypothetical protein
VSGDAGTRASAAGGSLPSHDIDFDLLIDHVTSLLSKPDGEVMGVISLTDLKANPLHMIAPVYKRLQHMPLHMIA